MDKKAAFSNLLLDNNFQLLNRALKKVTIFDILGIENKEVPFTRLLTWLLNPHADHQMGAFPLRSFLRYCLRGREDMGDVITAMQVEELNFAEVSVNSEYQIEIGNESDAEAGGCRKGRLDVYAEYSGFGNQEEKVPLLVIEAKIGAEQHNDQTHLYQKWVKERSKEHTPFEPVLIYLTPDGDCEENVADGFWPMDFTLLNSWLESLRPVLKSGQAEFLIEELCSLNARTNRARALELEELVEKIQQENMDSLNVLKTGLHLEGAVMEEYEPALVCLGLSSARRGSLGYDDHIAIVRRAADTVFGGNERWTISGKEASLTIRYRPLQQALNNDYSASNVINLDCWLDRSKNHLELAVYSLKHKLPDSTDDARLRKSLVKELRSVCENSGLAGFKVQSGSNFQVARIDLPRGNTSLQSASEQLQYLFDLAQYFDKWLEDKFSVWKDQNCS